MNKFYKQNFPKDTHTHMLKGNVAMKSMQ